MIIVNNRMAYVNWYVTQKEYFLHDNVRIALNKIHSLISKRKVDKALAIHNINKLMLKNTGVELGKKFLREKYNSRCAHVRNALEEYDKWEQDFRERHFGLKKKLCECGCGQEVKKKKHRFIHGHNIRMRSKEEKKHYAKVMLNKRPKKDKDNKVVHVDFKSLHNST